MPRVAAVIAAAGAGVRFREAASSAPALPKTFVSLGGLPLWAQSATALGACREITDLAVVVPPAYLDLVRQACRSAGLAKVTAVVPGGERRQDSVLNALRALVPCAPDLVAVHDGARPLVPPDLVARCLRSAIERGSGVAALPVTDTLKRADAEGRVVATVDRASLWAMQTPQVFRFPALLAAHEAALAEGYEATDDAALMEHLGEPVWLVRGEETNLKVTTPADLRLAADLLGCSAGPALPRVGHGFDAHRFSPDRPCVLGGVTIPGHHGLAGHSDADVVTHALMDAVLGALALGDLGQHFPDSDPAYAGACSLDLAGQVASLVAENGYRVASLDATVICESPRIAPHAAAMRQALGRAFCCDPACVSVKGTTTEGLGFPGRGEGIAVHAIAVLAAQAS